MKITTPRATCRVCQVRYLAPLDRPALLCGDCARDIESTEAHVRARWDAACAHEIDCCFALTSLRDAAPAAVLVRYATVEAALSACLHFPDAALQRRLDATVAQGDALSPLVEALQAWAAAGRARAVVQSAAQAALSEIGFWKDALTEETV